MAKPFKMSRYTNNKNKCLDALIKATTDSRLMSIARRMVVNGNALNANNRKHGSSSPIVAMPSLVEVKSAQAAMISKRNILK